MPRLVLLYRLIALALLGCACTPQVNAEQPSQSHVLFSFDRKQEESEAAAPEPVVKTQAEETPVAIPSVRTDEKVVPAAHQEAAPQAPRRDSRRLGPLTRKELLMGPEGETAPSKGQLPFDLLHSESLGTAGAGLVLVVGLFLLCATLVRRSGPSPTTPLPREAVAVLGRVPLMPKQFAHLLQVGNKLVLVAISGDRTDAITEITDPAEVDRLLALCLRGSGQSSSAEFQRVLGQIAKEPTRGFLGREASHSRSVRG